MKKTFSGGLLLILSLACVHFAAAQDVPQMRTRLLTSLTNVEITRYLKRNDIIYIPVGTVEVHGGFPVDCEYVGPLAIAMKMAEETDGLVFPNMAYFYPGGTTVGEGTVYVTPEQGLDYLKALAHSLLRQGFRRQIYITMHGPSFETLSPLVREFFDETKDPILYLPAEELLSKVVNVSHEKVLYGAYSIVGRLDDIPLGLSEDAPANPQTNPANTELTSLQPGSGVVGDYQVYPSDHGGLVKPLTAEQRSEYAKEGVAQIDAAIAASKIKELVEDLQKDDKFIHDVILPKYGDLLNFNK